MVRLYRKAHRKHCYQKAVVAVGRHLAEAAYWVLRKQEVYRRRMGWIGSRRAVLRNCERRPVRRRTKEFTVKSGFVSPTCVPLKAGRTGRGLPPKARRKTTTSG